MTQASSVARRLAAILSADIAGYSRLMGEDEVATLRALKEHQARSFPSSSQFEGRIIDVAGDGILAEFPSAVGAVACAIEIQRVMAAKNAEPGESVALRFRIGVNLGDVIHEGERIYGDGINVAARIQALAQPGGVAVSRPVFEQVRNRIPERFVFLGAASLKNIREPVAIYEAVLPGPASPAWIERWRFALRTSTPVRAILAAASWARSRRSRGTGHGAAARPAAQPGGNGRRELDRDPSVPPARYPVGRDEHLGIGLADALITNLGNIQQLTVRPTSAVLRYDKAGRTRSPRAGARRGRADGGHDPESGAAPAAHGAPAARSRWRVPLVRQVRRGFFRRLSHAGFHRRAGDARAAAQAHAAAARAPARAADGERRSLRALPPGPLSLEQVREAGSARRSSTTSAR
jgi:class 3 adenylate cyclase